MLQAGGCLGLAEEPRVLALADLLAANGVAHDVYDYDAISSISGYLIIDTLA